MKAAFAPSTESNESQIVVLASGRVILFAGTVGLLYAMALGWAALAVTGAALLAIAWFVPTSTSARSLRYMLALLGVVALAVALFDLVT